MSFRPAGYSSDEDDEFNNFSFDGDVKSFKERQEEIVADNYKQHRELNDTVVQRLCVALINEKLELVKKELDENEVDINAFVTENWTPLYLASSQGNADIVNELLNRGADPKTNRDGFTALMAACNCFPKKTTSAKILAIVKQLIDRGADIVTIDRKRRTALMLAAEQGFSDVVQYLIPISKLDAEDNQGWTALFYAVNGNQPDIVTILLNAGSNLEHVDVRNNNSKYYATLNDFQKVLEAFPQDSADVVPDDLCIDETDIESLFVTAGKPDFSGDISILLYGMKCQTLISIFNKMHLSTFLTIDDTKLQDIGVCISFQRNRILQGLHNFHRHPWRKTSILIDTKITSYSTYDLYLTIANAVKHLIVMESSIKYLKQNYELHNVKLDYLDLKLSKASNKIRRLISAAKLLQSTAQRYDRTKGSADLITPKIKFRKNVLTHSIVVTITTISVLLYIKYG